MPDYKSNIIRIFRKYVDDILRSKYKSKSSRDVIKDDIQELIATGSGHLYGNIFYLVIKLIGEDIDGACDVLFYDQDFDMLNEIGEDESRLAKFLAPYTRTDAEIATAAHIDPARFSRVKNKLLADLYAFEVYNLAKVFSLKPSQLFDYFYGDGPRPVVELRTAK